MIDVGVGAGLGEDSLKKTPLGVRRTRSKSKDMGHHTWCTVTPCTFP